MSRRKRLEPFDLHVLGLAKGGVGAGIAPDGKPMHVRGAPPGSVIHVVPQGYRKGVYQGRRLAMVTPPPGAVEPRCAVFGLCGGCQLQEIDLEAQRTHKTTLARAQVLGDTATGHLRLHETRGTSSAWGYRNKVELSFGVRRYLSETDHQAGLPIAGRFLGMHAPGRFDRVVDTERCELLGDAGNAVVAVVRAHALSADAPLPWDVRSHQGFWRHLGIRVSEGDRSLLVCLYTSSGQAVDAAAVEDLAQALLATELPEGWRLAGVQWRTNDGVADVARGEIAQTWGEGTITETLLGKAFDISPESFFQTNTKGAEVLYQTIRDALGQPGGTLVDLYCGTGSIGIALSEGFDSVVGVEVVPEAVEHARENAARNGVTATFTAGKMEDALHILGAAAPPRSIVVDPPRAGLHPKVAASLATVPGDVLVYVACQPASLGRDRAILEAGHWRMTDLWLVDLFPHTGHMEAVARFEPHTPSESLAATE